jgi:rubrerythrin
VTLKLTSNDPEILADATAILLNGMVSTDYYLCSTCWICERCGTCGGAPNVHCLGHWHCPFCSHPNKYNREQEVALVLLTSIKGRQSRAIHSCALR